MWWYLLEVRNMGMSEALEVQSLTPVRSSSTANDKVVVAECTAESPRTSSELQVSKEATNEHDFYYKHPHPQKAGLWQSEALSCTSAREEEDPAWCLVDEEV